MQDTKNSAVDQFQEERRKIQQTMDTLRTSVDALKKVQEQRRSRIKQIDEVKGTLVRPCNWNAAFICVAEETWHRAQQEWPRHSCRDRCRNQVTINTQPYPFLLLP